RISLIASLLIPALSLSAQVYLDEQFSNNNNRWSLTGTLEDRVMSAMRNGRYFLHHKENEEKTGTNWGFVNVYFDPSEDFEIEAFLTRVSGHENHAYSVVFGILDSKNYQ